jgi:hypothetical protein
MLRKVLFPHLLFVLFAVLAVSCPNNIINNWYDEEPSPANVSDKPSAGTVAADTCDLLLYYFTDPACVGTFGSGSGSTGDPVLIGIIYPLGENIPNNNDDIKIFHNGKGITANDTWSEAGVRNYTVTAESGKQKHYRVIAAEDTVPPGEACDILLYYFTKPNGDLLSIGKLVLDDSSGEEEDPVKITITYPDEIPDDGHIVVLLSMDASIAPKSSWTANGDSFVRDYTVTAASGKQKHYRVTATKDVPPPLSDSCDIIQYRFPSYSRVGVLVLNNQTGGTGDPIFINITYPYWAAIPADASIQITHTGTSVSPDGPWIGGVRDYTVTAASGKQKHYRVTATQDTLPLSDSCDILLYCFTSPDYSAGIFVPGNGDGSAGNPVLIGITLSNLSDPPSSDYDFADIPADDDIQIVHTGDKIEGDTGWSTDGVRNYSVTAKNGKQKHYRVLAMPSYDIETATEWNDAMTFINGTAGSAASPRMFKLNIADDFTLSGISSGSNFSGGYKGVWLTGDKTISISGSGSLIQTAVYQTFIIDGPTLQGASGSGGSLVTISNNSAGELRSGEIKGSADGGVLVYGNGAIFTMSGGTISGNTTTTGGGGVYVLSGTFTMNDGTISENTDTSPTGGGGVYVSNGTFTMNGGTISENTANLGGGVCHSGSGTFTMDGGTISGNTATYSGGGVLVKSGGAFTKIGGIIYGDTDNTHTPGSNENTATSSSDTGKNGHAVFLDKFSVCYYRNEDLTGTDNISTMATLPTTSGATAGNWTRQ